ncbi:MAG: enoyl-CoA hydratase-related protein [Isosphaeraceae bacterium]
MSSATSQTTWRWERGALGINTLWFDQPGRSHNVLSAAALDELEALLIEAESERGLRGLVIRSAKSAGFCAGADLKTILSCTTRESLAAYFERGQAVFDRLAALRVPAVAVLHGACLGGGLELPGPPAQSGALGALAPAYVVRTHERPVATRLAVAARNLAASGSATASASRTGTGGDGR